MMHKDIFLLRLGVALKDLLSVKQLNFEMILKPRWRPVTQQQAELNNTKQARSNPCGQSTMFIQLRRGILVHVAMIIEHCPIIRTNVIKAVSISHRGKVK